MIDQPTSLQDLDWLNWQSINTTQTELLAEQIQQAARLSQAIYLPEQRWQVYLAALGAIGFEQWLSDRAPDLQVHSEGASIWQPAYANLMSVVCNFQVNCFRLCLVVCDRLNEEFINCPSAIFNLPDFAAHFYILIQVEEEQQQVAVSGFLNYEQYHQHQANHPLQPEPDWTYTLPRSWFNCDPNALLLNLRCLAPDAIILPTTTSVPQERVAALQQKLTMLQSQLSARPLWELLTLQEGMILLKDSQLVNLVYGALASQPPNLLINVSFWLRNQLDTLAQELGWMLMPSLIPSAMRSLEEEFDQIRVALELQGIHIPLEARGAYRDLHSSQSSLRLYAVTWVLSEVAENREWMLLVALSPQPGVQKPRFLKLEIKDETQPLFEQAQEDTNQNILFAQVIGNWGERFWVTVTADETVFAIPPFSFELDTSV